MKGREHQATVFYRQLETAEDRGQPRGPVQMCF